MSAEHEEWCGICGAEDVELCRDGFCRECHVDLTFEDCNDGSYNVEILRANGHTDEELRRLCPNAAIWQDSVEGDDG